MRDSVEAAKRALTSTSSTKDNISALAQAIQTANDCFERWGLNKGELKDHLNVLTSHGALAVKPTGAGNGGYVISLWRETPPKDLPFNLIPII